MFDRLDAEDAFFALLFLDWLLDNADGILHFIHAQEHSLYAQEAIEGNLLHDLVVLFNFLLEELAYVGSVYPVALLQDTSEELEESPLVSREFGLDDEDVPQALELLPSEAIAFNLHLFKNEDDAL